MPMSCDGIHCGILQNLILLYFEIPFMMASSQDQFPSSAWKLYSLQYSHSSKTIYLRFVSLGILALDQILHIKTNSLIFQEIRDISKYAMTVIFWSPDLIIRSLSSVYSIARDLSTF
jgi:hypothetical protein